MPTLNDRVVARADAVIASCRRCPVQRGRILRAFAMLEGVDALRADRRAAR
ncbi:hypothetical protein [Sphingomonas yantingensis]|uniref:Uncharacterized protein n=1 Tax=Sphingomonas yantingensis TaxID=1241761 RepID=A0A7W9ARL3_9SPHN|nr:hypothetical protein [Sphingomonas yantingensis]MBB5699161.1 hypothetical protein [Sphingomonas yantingensis]